MAGVGNASFSVPLDNIAECQQTFVDNKIRNDDSAFSPSIIEIGFIDEDETISDLSELSASDEDKVRFLC
ncbi:hypothetical protein CEXT_307821 [Caerostris extrusa]|uniref:Uncharacterized protein n=1 Tax=Caerostris extrusa TaxID=172846 RepID=A0AAV4XER4_CAEEX|nr:hypothetical protein CEXT_307821 [Caerostris extrusa]